METSKQGTDINALTKLFSAYVVSLPITQYYKSPLSVFNFATFMVFVFFVIFMIRAKGIIVLDKRSFPIFLFMIFITINLIVTAILYHISIAQMSILDYFRSILLLVTIIVLGSKYFDRGYALKILEMLLLASTFYMLLQLILKNVFHHPISGNIGSLVTKSAYAGAKIRPSGFYMEPAAFAQGAMIYISFMLFGKEDFTKKDKAKLICVMVGILFSGSGQGYALLALILFMWFLYHMFFKSISKKTILKGALVILVSVLALGIVLRTSYGQFVISRIINEERETGGISLGGKALSGRTYTNRFFYALSSLQQITGVGFGRSESVVGDYYINSLYYYLIECGYISIAIWIIMGIMVFKRGNISVKVFTLIYAIMFYFSGCGRPMMICYYFMFLLYDNYKSMKYNIGNTKSGSETDEKHSDGYSA